MTGLLLVNLGTTDAPDASSVRRYLRQFLSDPRVLDINPIGRAALLHLFILPFRPAKSAHAYRKVWTDRGSPLLFHSCRPAKRRGAYCKCGPNGGSPLLFRSVDLVREVRARLDGEWTVELAM